MTGLVYADTWFWVALAHRLDPNHERAMQINQSFDAVRIVTTEEVLGEFLNTMAGYGPKGREKAVEMVQAICDNPNITVNPQTRESFKDGLNLYRERCDKEYSFIDCVSMVTMKKCSISDVVTGDKHFEQEGFARIPK